MRSNRSKNTDHGIDQIEDNISAEELERLISEAYAKIKAYEEIKAIEEDINRLKVDIADVESTTVISETEYQNEHTTETASSIFEDSIASSSSPDDIESIQSEITIEEEPLEVSLRLRQHLLLKVAHQAFGTIAGRSCPSRSTT